MQISEQSMLILPFLSNLTSCKMHTSIVGWDLLSVDLAFSLDLNISGEQIPAFKLFEFNNPEFVYENFEQMKNIQNISPVK